MIFIILPHENVLEFMVQQDAKKPARFLHLAGFLFIDSGYATI